MRIIIRAITLLFCLVGCVPALQKPEAEIVMPKRVASMIQLNQEKHQRLSGKFKMRGTGLKALFGSVDFTIVLQQPSSLYIAMPSFFGTPARVVTSDGKNNYILDITEKTPFYAVEESTENTLERWMGFDIQPREFVHVLLGLLDLTNGAIVDIALDRGKARYNVKVRYEDKRECLASFDANTDDLLSQAMYKNGVRVYAVNYSDFRDSNVGRFAWYNEVSLKGNNGAAKLTLSAEELSFDEKPFDTDVFQIEEP